MHHRSGSSCVWDSDWHPVIAEVPSEAPQHSWTWVCPGVGSLRLVRNGIVVINEAWRDLGYMLGRAITSEVMALMGDIIYISTLCIPGT